LFFQQGTGHASAAAENFTRAPGLFFQAFDQILYHIGFEDFRAGAFS
jgi:hypothetical protein